MISYQLKLEYCSAAKNTEYVRQLFFILIDEISLHIRGVTEQRFYPEGLVLSMVLAEGYASMYAHPSLDGIDIDIYSDSKNPELLDRCLNEAMTLFVPHSIRYIVTDRISMEIVAVDTWSKT